MQLSVAMFIALNDFWNLQTENKHFGLDSCFAFPVSDFKNPSPEGRGTLALAVPIKQGLLPSALGRRRQALLPMFTLSPLIWNHTSRETQRV